jgi:homoserine kinase
MLDLLAEPHRQALLPGFTEARTELEAIGALATGISGSGPTIFCIVDDSDIAKTAAEWLESNYLQNDDGFVRICRADLVGARTV